MGDGAREDDSTAPLNAKTLTHILKCEYYLYTSVCILAVTTSGAVTDQDGTGALQGTDPAPGIPGREAGVAGLSSTTEIKPAGKFAGGSI